MNFSFDEDDLIVPSSFHASNNHAPIVTPVSPHDSHRDLNADLLMQNIYRAEEFFDSEQFNRSGFEGQIVALVRTETQALHQNVSGNDLGSHQSSHQRSRAASRTHQNKI